VFKTFAIVAAILIGATCYGQTLAPLHAEHSTKPGKTVRGSFQVQNNNLTPEALVIEARDLQLDVKGGHFGPLPPTTTVTLSQSSARLGPKQILQIDYKVTCQNLPCNVSIANGFSVGHTADGIEVKLVLPFSVYLAHSKHPRQDALHAAGLDVATP
jgi:hypothetical protein